MSKRLAIVIALVLFSSLIMVSIPIKAQSTDSIVINPDGSVTGTYSIQQVGNTYTLTTNITGNIRIEKSNIVINGTGYTLDGNGNGGIQLTNNTQYEYNNPMISNVTIENMYLKNAGIETNGGGNDTFYNNVFSGGNQQQGGFSILLLGCSYNNISYCSFDNGSQISMDYSANLNTVTECNLPSFGILVWLSGSETVDRNYWSDYSTKYPNATEVDHSGVGNQPYVYSTVQNGAQTTYYQDNHPLMKPIAIPLIGSKPQTNVPEFPSLLVVIPLLLSAFCVALILKNRKNNNSASKPIVLTCSVY